jgi:GAF domain-containing protein
MTDLSDISSADNLRQEQALLEFSNAILQRISTAAPLAEVLNFIACGIEAIEPEMRCSVLLLDQSGQHLLYGAAPSLPREYNTAIDGIEIGPSVGSCGTAAYRGEAVFVADIACDPLWANFKGLALGCGLAACWSSPIMSTQGKVLGTFAVYWTTPRQEVSSIARRYVETATRLAGIAIESARRETVLHGQLEELRRWQQLTLGREGRVLSLKREVNGLLARLGEPPRYGSVSGEEDAA